MSTEHKNPDLGSETLTTQTELRARRQASRHDDVLPCVNYINNIAEHFGNREEFIRSVILELNELARCETEVQQQHEEDK